VTEKCCSFCGYLLDKAVAATGVLEVEILGEIFEVNTCGNHRPYYTEEVIAAVMWQGE
jgi:hypothetical protein